MDKQPLENDITAKELIVKLKEWYSYFLSKWLTIVIFGVSGSILGLTYSLFQKPMYTASLSFALESQDQSRGLGGALGLASQFGFDIRENGGNIFAGANLIELFKSRKMIEQTLLSPVMVPDKKISFAEMYLQDSKWREGWSDKPAMKNIQFPPNANRNEFSRIQDSLLGLMYQTISIGSLNVEQKDKSVEIISIEMKSPNEIFAKYFTEALANVVSDFYVTTKTTKARQNMEILVKQTDSVRNALNSAITGVAVANDNVFSLNPALNVQRTPSSRRQVDVQTNAAILNELVKQAEVAKVVLRKETPLIQVIDRPIFPLKKEKFGKLKGLVLGGLIAGFFIVFILIIKRVYQQITSG